VLGHAFHHIGITCADIEETAQYVRSAYSVTSDSGTIHDPLQNADVRLFNEGLPGAIELVSGPVVQELVKQDVTYYHICYSTGDLEASIASAKALGAVSVSPPTPAVLFGGRRVAFVFTRLGLVEFLEEA
jgi:methylmalonyl-CoA/ethylmalonyl-CoA epimerase